MFAALILGVALMSSDSGSPPVTSPELATACRLARDEDAAWSSKTYSVAGVYMADGMHGAWLDTPGCDGGFRPYPAGAFLDRIDAFHDAFAKKCGSPLFGDHVSGVFTGRLERRKGWNILTGKPEMQTFFAVTDVETTDEDPASITCPK